MPPALRPLAAVPFYSAPTPVEELSRLGAALGAGPRLLVKRDDTIGFAFGGNKVRKMALVAADAQAHAVLYGVRPAAAPGDNRRGRQGH